MNETPPCILSHCVWGDACRILATCREIVVKTQRQLHAARQRRPVPIPTVDGIPGEGEI